MSEAPERIWMDPDIKFLECEKQYGCDVEYVKADPVKELERNILAAERRLKRLARWLDLSDDELNNLPIGFIIDDHKKMQADVNAVLAALKGEIDE